MDIQESSVDNPSADKASVDQMWRVYLERLGETPETTERSVSADSFGMDSQTADELADLVKRGEKRATCSALWMYEHDSEPLPYEGLYTVVVNGRGQAECVIRTTRIDVMRFDEVDPEFAREEGEGDQSLDYWQTVHRNFFSEELATIGRSFDEAMPVICERFEKVYP